MSRDPILRLGAPAFRRLPLAIAYGAGKMPALPGARQMICDQRERI